jgi:CelD/BcsL family acetyltransferase involved in cellulose biosynthesis
VHGRIDSSFAVEWRALTELGAVATQWRELAARALEPNIFYEPSFAAAAAPVFGADAGAGLIWSRAAPRRLAGLFPTRMGTRRFGIALPMLVGWTHPYAPLGVPLVDREMCDGVLSTWLGHVARHPKLPKLLLLPYLPAEGDFAAALDRTLAQQGAASAVFDRHARAVLAPGKERERYLARALGGKKRKELRRQRKRLADGGELSSTVSQAAGSLARALDGFLELEAQGWKGRAGTAARCDQRVARFVQTAVGALAAEGKVRIQSLCMDGKPIAATVILRSGDSAWCWKIAYDESRARFSPGVQVILDATEALLADDNIICTDSCATPDHPMIDHIWRQKRVLADYLISLDSGASLQFALARTIEGMRRRAIRYAKAARGAAGRLPFCSA